MISALKSVYDSLYERRGFGVQKGEGETKSRRKGERSKTENLKTGQSLVDELIRRGKGHRS